MTEPQPYATPVAFRRVRSLLAGARSLDDALGTVAPFLDPLFAGKSEGMWDPSSRTWFE